MPNHPTAEGRSRRDVLIGGAALASALSLGCRQPVEPTSAPASSRRTDVPLRVVLCGTESDREAIERAWGAVASQPLELTVINVDRADPGGLIDKIVAASAQSDLIVYPVLVVAELSSRELLTPLSDDEFKLAEEQGGPFFPALRNGIARFGGLYVAAPLGARQPALMSIEAVDEMRTWSDYDQWVQSLDGAAAEPLADGWAAAMFLWRAASSIEQGWLFGPSDLEPQIDRDPYQNVLAQMQETAGRYKVTRSTPQQIWTALTSGSLRGGLGFNFGAEMGDAEISFRDPPSEVLTKILADPFSPVASLAAQCRQTAASKQFIRWLSGGEGSESVRRQVSGMTVTRASVEEVEGGSHTGEGYELWLSGRLQIPNTLPTLELLAADEYYAALDRQIIRCLEGEQEPASALEEVKNRWQAIGDRVGIPKQQRAWRRVQGMIA